MKRIAAILIVTVLVLVPFGQALAWTDNDETRGPGPFAAGDPWSDYLDDTSHVYVPPGGLRNVVVSGGEVRLSPGHDEGWVASTPIAVPDGYRYDLVLLDAVTPGNSYVNITILDPSQPPTSSAFANATVPGFINMTGTDDSVFRVAYKKYPEVRIQVTLVANGTDRPTLQGWSLHFIPLGEWKDSFLGQGKMTAHGGIQFTGAEVELDLTGGGSGASYDPYPAVLFPDGRGDVDVFYPTATNDGYQNGATIASTASTNGLAVGDLDDDGNMDIVMAGGGGNVNSMILWGSSSGTWSTSDKTDLSHQDTGEDAAVGDFDGDGMLDVVIAAVGGMIHDGSYVYLNNGDGSFDKDWDIKIGNAGASNYVAAGDLNDDGYDDIVFVKSLVMSAIAYFGGPSGPGDPVDINFLQNMAMTGRGDLCIEDIDEDGHLDVLFATVDNMEAPIYLGSSTGPDTTVDYSLKLKGLPREVDVGDINDDGYLDIAYLTFDSTGTNALIEIFKGTKSGWSVYSKHDIVTQSTTPNAMEVIDIDVDGYEDIVMGDSSTFYLYKGGSTWPTTHSMSKTGLGAPYDVAVAASASGGGGTYRGSFVSDPIPLPDGMKWDILHLDADLPENTSVSISVLDTSMDPILGYEQLTDMSVDLSDVGSWKEVYVKIEMWSGNNTTTPVLESLLVNWLDEMAWRDQFYGDVKTESSLGLGSVDLQLEARSASSYSPDLLFANLRSNSGYDTKSLGFVDGGRLDYTSIGPLPFGTAGATAVAVNDVNGDGYPDMVFSNYGSNPTTFVGKSPLFLGSPAGWYNTPVHSFDTVGASDVALEDLNDDGFMDVLFAQERDGSGPDITSSLFWGSASGWNATPDVELETSGAVDVEVVDVDNDDRLDLVFACFKEESAMATSMFFIQEDNGTYDTEPWGTFGMRGARAVASGDLNKDGKVDLLFACPQLAGSYNSECYLFYGMGGGAFQTPSNLPTLGAYDVKIADLNSDTYPDIVFANYRNESGGYLSAAYIYLNDGSGGFGASPDVMVPTEGAYAVEVADLDGVGFKDLIFACLNNGTGFNIPSVAYLGGSTGWSSVPDIEFPTIGAVDVRSLSLSDSDHGGYLSRPITPKTEDDIGAYHTLMYESSIGPSVTGTIAIIDADTGEVLATTSIASGTKTWDLRDAVSYRDHPSIRVLIAIEGLDGGTFSLDDLWLNWTKRVLEFPVVADLGLEDTSVHRTETVRLWIDVSDDFDAPEDLTVLIEHQLEGETTWKTSMLGALTFTDGLWWRDVTPDRFQPLGVYSFRVNVTDSDRGASGYVDFPSTLEVLPNLLGAPRLLTATAGAGSIQLEWRAPLDTGDLPVDGYRVLRGTSDDDLAVIDSVDQFADGYTDTGLVNGVTYYYSIVAFNDLGDSPWSDILNATPVDVPGMAQNLVAEAGDGTVTLTWYPPLQDGGVPILGYHVLRGESPDSLVEIADIGSEGSYTDEALVNGMVYYYSVLAYNNVGPGPRTEPMAATPMGLPDAPTGLTSEVSTQGVSLRWLAPGDTGGGALIGFTIYRGLTDDALEELESVSGTTTQFLDDDVDAGTTYYYAVAAETAAGEGPRSPALDVTALGQPSVPMNLIAEAGDGKVTLSWLAPTSDGGSPVTGYVVLRGASPTSLSDLAELSIVLSYVDTTAVNGETYHYAVIAVNALGRGPESDSIDVTPFVPTSVPGKVAAFTAETKGTKAILAWTAPADDGACPITGYVILRGETRDTMVEIDQVGVVLTYTDDGLERGKTYYYSVKAVNAVGQGDAFEPQSVKVQKEETDEDGIPMAIIIAVIGLAVIVLVAMIMRPGHGKTDAQETPEEAQQEPPEDSAEAEEETPKEIVIEHREV